MEVEMEIREWIEEHGRIRTIHVVPVTMPREFPSRKRGAFRIIGWQNIAIAEDGTRRGLSEEDEAALTHHHF